MRRTGDDGQGIVDKMGGLSRGQKGEMIVPLLALKMKERAASQGMYVALRGGKVKKTGFP